MKKDFKQSKTYKNLQTAFAGESQARNKYSYYASQAKKEGLNIIAQLFEETANNEKEHAKLWFKLLNDGIKNTASNLKDAISGEDYEFSTMYKEFATIAKKEGYLEIAKLFEKVGLIEKNHRDTYKAFLQCLKNKKIFNDSKSIEWRCSNCGRIIKSNKAPKACDVCSHPQAYFKRNCCK